MAIGKLSVILTADMGEFSRNMGKAAGLSRREMRQMQRDAERAMKAISLVAAAAGAALVAMTVKQMRATDELTKQARVLNTTNEGLASYRLAADMAGLGAQGFDNALNRMRRALGDASKGTGEQAEALKLLNVELKDLEGLKADEQFKLLSERVAGLGSEFEQSRVATALFGRDSQRVLEFMREGAQNADALRERMVRANAVLGAVPSAQIEAANDAMTMAKELSKGLGNTLAVQVAPIIEHVANLWADSAEEAGGYEQIVADMVPKVVAGIGMMADALEAVRRILRAVGLMLGNFAGAVSLSVQKAVHLLPDFIKVRMGIEGTGPVGPIPSIMEGVSDIFMEDLPGQELMERVQDIFVQSRIRAEEAVRNRREMNGPILLPDDELGEIEANANASVEAISAYADQAARNIQSSFADFLFDPFDKGLKGMLKGFVNAIRRMVAEAAAARILGGGLGGVLNSFLGGIGLGGLPGRAVGGPVIAGSPVIVGERGPEVFVPQTAGRVNANGQGGGGVTVNYGSMHFATGVDLGAVAQLLDDNRRRTVSEVETRLQHGAWA